MNEFDGKEIVFFLQYGSWILTALGLVAVLLVGLGSPYGAIVGIIAQPFWVVYGWVTGQDGFIVWGIAFAVIYSVILVSQSRRPKQQNPCEVCAEVDERLKELVK